MLRRFSALVYTATLASVALSPRWSEAQTTQGYDNPKDAATKTDTNAAPTAQGYSASQGHNADMPRVTEMFTSPDEHSRAGIHWPCRGGYCRPRCLTCLGRRTYGYPYYGPSYAAFAQTFPSDCFPVLGVIYRNACSGAGSCAYGPSLPLPDAANGVVSPGKKTSADVPTNLPAVSPEKEKSLPHNAARLQLIVPQNAEVVIDDHKSTRTGTVRQFVSPPLAPGKSFTYQIVIRYRDANGSMIEDKHSIRVHANDQLRMDFTQTASPPRQEQDVTSARK